jgi:hypothetical protein
MRADDNLLPHGLHVGVPGIGMFIGSTANCPMTRTGTLPTRGQRVPTVLSLRAGTPSASAP